MQLIFQQLGELLVGAIPTALLFIVLVIAYQFLIQGPLTAVLAKRRALTEGAIEDARKAVAVAEPKPRNTPSTCGRRAPAPTNCASSAPSNGLRSAMRR